MLRADLAIDAMYGTGFRGELTGTPAAVANQLESLGLPVLAVDIPSGVRGATGAVEFVAVRATETICFAAYKPGLLFEPGRSHAGRIEVVDIGIGVDNGATLCVLEVDDLSLPEPEPDEHKWSSGCLVVGGSNGMVGAPVLAGRAALRTGAGMVVCAVPGSNAAANVSGHELVARVLPATDDGSLDQGAADEVLEEVARYRVVAIGPGLGRDPATQAAVRAIVADAGVPLVIDADALERGRGRSVGTAGAATPRGIRLRYSRRTRASTSDWPDDRSARTGSRPLARSPRSSRRSWCSRVRAP